MNINYEFVGIDEGKQNLFRGDTNSGEIHWTKSLSDYPKARAMQRLDHDRILLGHDKGYCIVDINNGKILHDYSCLANVTSAYRLSDGTTLLAGLNLNGKTGICVISLDSRDNIFHTAVQEGDYVRLMTVTDDGRYILSTNDHITICNRELNILQKLSAPGFLHAWQTRIMDDGSYLVSAGYGAFIAWFSSKGRLVGTFGKTDEVPAAVKPNFYASFNIARDRTILVANWQGHGIDNGDKGRQLLQFSPEGTYLKSWSFPEKISSFQGLILL